VLSIVIPSRDTCALTLACLRSVAAAADGLRLELILVDDGSRDDTRARVRVEFPAVRIIRHDIALGFTQAANAGLRAATGARLLLLNSDTEVQRAALHALTSAFDREAQLGVAGAQLLNPDGSAQWSGSHSVPGAFWLFAQASGVATLIATLPGYRRLKPLGHGDRTVAWVSGAALAFRREVWDQCGPLDERFQLYAQDLDLCARAGDAGWTVGIVGGFTVTHHQGATVAQLSAARVRQEPSLLWSDLVRWTEKAYGHARARRAIRAIEAGAKLQLLVRWMLSRSMRGERRLRWSAQSDAIGAALRAMRAGTR
jgi:GT2 family glycosyltransferase